VFNLTLNRLVRLGAVLLIPWWVAACSSPPLNVARGDDTAFIPAIPEYPMPTQYNNGAIFQASHGGSLFDDNKARRVGDILTVRLVERTQASQSSNTSSSKESDLGLADPTLFGGAVTLGGRSILQNSLSGSRAFDGQANSAQSNRLDGLITVTVAHVLPNGNLLIQGEKWMQINQGEEYIRLRGMVRPVDIRADNTVLSTQIADAQVSYGGTGTLADSNRAGWLAQFFNSPIWPF